MIKGKSLRCDGIAWVLVMIVAAGIAFTLLKRDQERHFGAVSFGPFPEFQSRTIQGESIDNHRMKSRVWAVHVGFSEDKAMSVSRQMAMVEASTASGKRHLYILTFIDDHILNFKSLTPHQSIVRLKSQEIAAIFNFTSEFNENTVFLIDQNGIIRGRYDVGNVDDYRRFTQDLSRLL